MSDCLIFVLIRFAIGLLFCICSGVAALAAIPCIRSQNCARPPGLRSSVAMDLPYAESDEGDTPHFAPGNLIPEYLTNGLYRDG